MTLVVGVDEDRHRRLPLLNRRRSGPLRAASSIVGLLMSLDAGMPASRMIWRPSSALVPSRRITIGARRSTAASASTMPLATSSPRVMPPKMLTKIERTFSS